MLTGKALFNTLTAELKDIGLKGILNDEVSANAILKRVTKHYTVVIKPQTTT